jgi:hypothetical protein
MKRTLSAGVGLLLLLLAPGLAIGQAEKPTDVSGDWEMTAETPFGTFTSTLKLEKQGDALTGRVVGEGGEESKLDKVKLAGKTIGFERDITVNGLDLHLVYTGAVDGDSIKGTFEANGQMMTWTAKRKTVVAGVTGASLAGTWKLQLETPNGTRERTLVLKQDGDRTTGTITGRNDEAVPLTEVSLKGRELRFTVAQERDGNTIRRTYVATVDGDSLKGTIEGGNQARGFTGKRDAAPVVPGPAAAVPVLAGAWKLTVMADQTHRPTLHLTEQAGKLSGKLAGEDGGEWMLKDVVVKGNQLDFAVDITVDGQEIHLNFTGTIEGDRLKGAFSQGGASYATTGERQPKA